ncbi:MAG: hypothetical protein SV862_00045 [Pseudomonadota bacterium]|nr:hypothetical protein [Pseudomonadota bacterium]
MDLKLFSKTLGLVMWVGWGPPYFSWADGHYFGWRQCICLGPLIIFWGLMTEAEVIADAERVARETQLENAQP